MSVILYLNGFRIEITNTQKHQFCSEHEPLPIWSYAEFHYSPDSFFGFRDIDLAVARPQAMPVRDVPS
jgi:hypothetical protein